MDASYNSLGGGTPTRPPQRGLGPTLELTEKVLAEACAKVGMIASALGCNQEMPSQGPTGPSGSIPGIAERNLAGLTLMTDRLSHIAAALGL
jgi:hypothetical protein